MISTASYTHTGRRHSNQDSVLVRTLSNGAEVVAVADGMGGHSAGEVASAIALEALSDGLEKGLSPEEAVAAANVRVFHSARERPEWQGMGTTLVVLLRNGNSYVIANVGDSRAYAIDGGGIQQITEDHSYVAEALRSGAMTEAEVARSPWRNALTRAIGTDAKVAVDLFGPIAVEEPQVVLLCSDGLYKSVGEDLIREYILSIDELGSAMETLAALAYRRGSDDNITVAAVEFGALERRPPQITLPLAIHLQSAALPAAKAGAKPAQTRPARPAPSAEPVAAKKKEVEVRSPSPPAPARRRSRQKPLDKGLQQLLLVLLVLAVIALLWWVVG